jgi:3-hydroxyisobutyrate dehydrogenase
MHVAVLGLGAMGSRMARRLVEKGNTVTVFNRTRAAAEPLAALGAKIAETPRQAALGAEVVLCMVRDDEASRRIWLHPKDGAALGLRQGAVAVEASTVSAAHIAALSLAVADRGASLVDAPVVGSRPQADAGQLIVLAGGPTETVDSLRPLFAAFAGTVHHTGALGSAATVKLAANALFATQIAVLRDCLTALSTSGFDLAALQAAFTSLPVVSPAAKAAASLILGDKHEPLFPIELVAKDLRYFVECLSKHGTSPVIAHAVYAAYDRAAQGELAGRNITAIK